MKPEPKKLWPFYIEPSLIKKFQKLKKKEGISAAEALRQYVKSETLIQNDLKKEK